MTKEEKLIDDLFAYFETHKYKAKSDHFNWYIGDLTIWIANGHSFLSISPNEYSIPDEVFTKEIRKEVWNYYLKWLDNHYTWEPPKEKEPKGFFKRFFKRFDEYATPYDIRSKAVQTEAEKIFKSLRKGENHDQK